MSDWNRTRRALATLLPAGILGASTLLGAAQATTLPAKRQVSDPADVTIDVAQRLADIRANVATTVADETASAPAANYPLLAWLNIGGGFGWRNGGWRNWGNGWHNWGNGWHNWGNGWHNWGNGGWHNFWHNW